MTNQEILQNQPKCGTATHVDSGGYLKGGGDEFWWWDDMYKDWCGQPFVKASIRSLDDIRRIVELEQALTEIRDVLSSHGGFKRVVPELNKVISGGPWKRNS